MQIIESYQVSKEGRLILLRFHDPAVTVLIPPQMARDLGALMVAYGRQLGAKEPISQEECESRPPPQPSW